jgi:hypothetical protein
MQVFRGLCSVELPLCFFVATPQGCRAGVEGAFMSTTTRKEVALQYAAKGKMQKYRDWHLLVQQYTADIY